MREQIIVAVFAQGIDQVAPSVGRPGRLASGAGAASHLCCAVLWDVLLLYTGTIVSDREEVCELPWLEDKSDVFEQRVNTSPDADEILRKGQ